MFEEYVNNANIKQIFTPTTKQCFSGKSKSGTDETNNWTDERSKSKQKRDHSCKTLCERIEFNNRPVNIETKTVGTLFAQTQHECFYVKMDKKTVTDTRVEVVKDQRSAECNHLR